MHRRPLLKFQAFTLIELMIVVSIIGILSTTAIPAFEKYMTKARDTEALVGTKAFMDAQVSNFFASGRFVTIRPPGYARLTAEGEPFKDPVFPENSKSWSLIGTPFPNGGNYRYTYASLAGYIDAAGVGHSSAGADGNIRDGVQNFPVNDRDGQVYDVYTTHDGDACQFTIDFDGLGIAQTNNEDWVFSVALADFKDTTPELCSMFIMSMAHRNNGIVKSPIITLNQGE